jgi:hypothetical protein
MRPTARYIDREFDEESFVSRAAGFSAFVIPAVLSILSASAEPYWLDSPELTAAAQTLGMPHPPGHPLYVTAVKIFTLIPLGSIAFRVSAASAIFSACASFLLFKICFTLISLSTRTPARWIAAITALSASLFASFIPAWQFQSVHQEVYSLQILLMLAAFYPAMIFCSTYDEKKERLLYLSAFFIGLGLSNHPVVTASWLPAFVPVLVFAARNKSGVETLRHAASISGITLFGLLAYVLPPLRAASGAAISLGGVHSLSDFFFVVSATAYQKSMAAQYTEGFGKPPVNTMIETTEHLGVFAVAAMFLGIFLLLRARRTRLGGTFIALSAAIPLLLRLATGFDLFRPDYQGYLLLPIAVSAAGFSVFTAVTLRALLMRARWGRRLLIPIAILLLVRPVAKAQTSQQETDLSRFRAGRLFTDFCLDRAAPGTLVLVSNYNLFFTLWSSAYIDGSRPDLFTVNPMLLSYPGYLNFTLASRPALAPLARSMLVHGTLTESAVAEAALNQPLRVEPSLELNDAAARYLLPDGPIFRALPQPTAESDVEAASIEHENLFNDFYHLLGGSAGREEETRRMLFYAHYQDALFCARRGDLDGAEKAAEAALVLSPDEPKTTALKKALNEAKAADKRIDITPYLSSAPSP